MADVNNAVITEMIDQYNLVKKDGSKMEICVQAETVQAAYLQAKDEDQYKHWREIASQDCTAAGMPPAN